MPSYRTLTAALQVLERLPDREDIRDSARAVLSNTEVIASRPLPKGLVEDVLDALFRATSFLEAPMIARLLVSAEIARARRRFSMETFYGWFDCFAKKGWGDELDQIVKELGWRGLLPRPERIIHWGVQIVESGDRMKPGTFLLGQPECRTHPSLPLGRIADWTLEAARKGDHASTRLFALLILNYASPVKKMLAPKKIKFLARLIETAEYYDAFLGPFLLEMVRSRLAPSSYRALAARTETFIRIREAGKIRAMRTRRAEFKKLLNPH